MSQESDLPIEVISIEKDDGCDVVAVGVERVKFLRSTHVGEEEWYPMLVELADGTEIYFNDPDPVKFADPGLQEMLTKAVPMPAEE